MTKTKMFLPSLLVLALAAPVPAAAQGSDLTTPPSLRTEGASGGSDAAVKAPSKPKRKAGKTAKATPAAKAQGTVETDAAAEDPTSGKGPEFAPSIGNSGAGFGFKF